MEEKKLGLFGVTSLTLVAIVGTGLFFGPAISASWAGTTALIAWVILGALTIYIGLIFAELVSLYPKSGGIYEFAKHAYGRFPSFIIGWIMWLVATINTSILVVGALQYSFPLLSFGTKLAFSLALVILLHMVAYKGLGASEVILDFFALALLGFVLLTIFGGVSHIDPTNYVPLWTATPLMLFVALFFILETNFGWEAASFLAEETKDPRRTIPKALIISTIIAAVLGIGLTAVLFGIIPVSEQNSGSLVTVFTQIFGGFGGTILRLGVFFALIGSAAGNIISGPRLISAMARDKLFIEQLSDKSPRTGTPGKAILFQAVVSGGVLFVALGDYQLLLRIMVPLAILMYIPTLLTLPILRIKNKEKRFFKTPFPFIGPIIASLVFISALVGWIVLDPEAIGVLRFIGSLLLFGFPIYLLLSVYYNPSTQLFFSDALAYPALALEGMIFPSKIRKKILRLFKDLSGKTVLELGAGVGSFTLHLAEAVTPRGKVFAIEAGRNNVDLLLKRIEKHSHEHVVTIHDEHGSSRLHPDVDHVDAVFSAGMLGYLQNREKVLKEIAAVLPEHAPVCFMEWVDYFGFLPNPAWLSNVEKLREEFQDAGFAVRVERVRGLFWNYLLVYGVRSSHRVPYI